jgi:hypothetical protein
MSALGHWRFDKGHLRDTSYKLLQLRDPMVFYADCFFESLELVKYHFMVHAEITASGLPIIERIV